jgi:hypothetical protein
LTRTAAVILLLLWPAALWCGGGCGGRTTASSLPGSMDVESNEPQWQDAFERTPEMVLVVRPQALLHDRMYGPVLGRCIELARQQSRMAVATGALDVMLDATEVIVGARDNGTLGQRGARAAPGAEDATDDLVVAVRGVRAEIDPAALVDEGGKAFWAPGPNAPSSYVRELLRVHDEGGVEASLFELPGRDWVIATGPARMRARDAFSRPSRRAGVPAPATLQVLDQLDHNALAVARVSGPALVARVGSLRPPSILAPIGHHLTALTITLPPGDAAIIRATLEYSGDAAALAEATLRDAFRVLVGNKPAEYAWLQSATVTRTGCCVVVSAPVPAQLLRKMPEPVSAPQPRDAPATH